MHIDGEEVELPYHPEATHCDRDGERTYVLDDFAADLVLQEMRLDGGADESKVYVKKAVCSQTGETITTAVWFTCAVADALCEGVGREMDVEAQLRELVGLWGDMARGKSAAGVAGASQQPGRKSKGVA